MSELSCIEYIYSFESALLHRKKEKVMNVFLFNILTLDHNHCKVLLKS